jgi:hypothetical protein
LSSIGPLALGPRQNACADRKLTGKSNQTEPLCRSANLPGTLVVTNPVGKFLNARSSVIDDGLGRLRDDLKVRPDCNAVIGSRRSAKVV